MVYCGKPSKGCGPCRDKRTKCDQTRPTCGQCRRAGRQCGGYRDESKLMFRDQSNDTASKFHVVEAAKKTNDPPTLPSSDLEPEDSFDFSIDPFSSSSELTLFRPTQNVISPTLNFSLEDQAVCHFFTNYVYSRSMIRRGHFEFLPSILAKNLPESPVAEIITSLGMSGLANVRNDPEAKALSTYKYTSALHGVNALLRDPDRATDDETLITVLLLGLYEVNNGVVVQSVKAWSEHINGAMALISLRGKEQLQSEIGLRLFYHLRSQIIIGCLHRRVVIPEEVIDWSRLACAHNSEPTPESKLADILFRFNNWRARELNSFTDYRNPYPIIEAALEFDNEMVEWLILFQLNYAYTTMSVDDKTDDVFADYYHIYPDLFCALIWQHFRCVRILINEILVTQIAALYYQTSAPSSPDRRRAVTTGTCKDVSLPPDFPFASNFYAAHALLTTLGHEICASVPFYLQFHVYGSDWANPDHPPPAGNGNLLLWPLFMVGQLSAVSPMMRKWTVGRMKRISEVMGVKQVGMIGEMLGKGEHLTVLDENP